MDYVYPEGFKPITLQAILDAAWQAFVIEDKPPAAIPFRTSYGRPGAPDEFMAQCQYRTQDGRKCAVGLLIPDGHPACVATAQATALAENFPGLFETHGNLWDYRMLQNRLHDEMVGATETTVFWKPEFDTPVKRAAQYRLVAVTHDLVCPSI